MWWIVGVVAIVVAIATYLTWIAARVDRLHQRATAANAALDAALVRRAAAAGGLATVVAVPRLGGLVHDALQAQASDREVAENDLTQALRVIEFDPAQVAAADGAWTELVAASRRVALARQVHTDLVRDARAMRRRRLVRLLRLSRRHDEPRYFDIDNPVLDDPPAAPGGTSTQPP
jgi:hypothetical protein